MNDKKEGLFIIINNSDNFNNKNNTSFNGKGKNLNYNSNMSIQYNQSFNSNNIEHNSETTKNTGEKLSHLKVNNSIYNSIKKNKFDSFSGENFVLKNPIPGISNFIDILNDYNAKLTMKLNIEINLEQIDEKALNSVFSNLVYESFFLFINDKPEKEILCDSMKMDKKIISEYIELMNFYSCVFEIYNGDLI